MQNDFKIVCDFIQNKIGMNNKEFSKLIKMPYATFRLVKAGTQNIDKIKFIYFLSFVKVKILSLDLSNDRKNDCIKFINEMEKNYNE